MKFVVKRNAEVAKRVNYTLCWLCKENPAACVIDPI